MKTASTIARYLAGVIFLVFGLNGFLNFIPPTPMPPLALQFVACCFWPIGTCLWRWRC